MHESVLERGLQSPWRNFYSEGGIPGFCQRIHRWIPMTHLQVALASPAQMPGVVGANGEMCESFEWPAVDKITPTKLNVPRGVGH